MPKTDRLLLVGGFTIPITMWCVDDAIRQYPLWVVLQACFLYYAPGILHMVVAKLGLAQAESAVLTAQLKRAKEENRIIGQFLNPEHN